MRCDIVDGLFEFHRDDDAGVIAIVEREPGGITAQIVLVPTEVWQRVWPRLVSLAEMRALSGGEYP